MGGPGKVSYQVLIQYFVLPVGMSRACVLSWLSSSKSLRGTASRKPMMNRAPSSEAIPTIREKTSCNRFDANDILIQFNKMSSEVDSQLLL